MFVSISVIEIRTRVQLEKNKTKQNNMAINSVKIEISHLFYKLFLIFSDIISFQHVLHLVLVEVKLSGN